MRKLNIFLVLLFGFTLQSCSYSSPKEALESNLVGKNYRQKTNSKTSGRYPDGNNSATAASSQQTDNKNYSAKRSDDNYDAYQHYQSTNTPKRAKRRPILNMAELNDLMDREANVIISEKDINTQKAPKIDANSNLHEVLKHNKVQKAKAKLKHKPKKRMKILVVRKGKNHTNSAKALSKAKPTQVASTKIKPTQVAQKKQAAPVKQAAPIKQVAPVIDLAPATIVTPPVAAVKTAPEHSQIIVAAPPVTPEVIAPKVTPASAPINLPAVPMPMPTPPNVTQSNSSVDLTKVSNQELEAHIKEKFNNDKPKNTYAAPSNAPLPPSIPLPSMPHATEANIYSGLNRLNNMFINCYYYIKHSMMSLISSWFEFEW